MTRTQLLSIAIVGTLVWVTGCGTGIELETGTRQAAVVNGQTDSGHPAVGLLKLSSALCTGTLIGSRTVLTAGHCAEGGSASFEVGGKSYPVAKMTPHPSYSSAVLNANDVAVVTLAQAVTGVEPVALSKTAPTLGEGVTIVGFGITGSGYNNAGTKRVTANTISEVKTQYFTFSGAGGSTGNTCSGDSGGPTFRSEGGKDVLLGVHSTASQPCGYQGNDMRVDQFATWIEATAGGDVGGPPPDTKPPTVSVTEPAAGATVKPAFTVKATAADETSLASITLSVDGQVFASKSASPASFDLNLAVGAHTLRVDAKDKAGNTGTAQLTVTVANPQTNPPPTTPTTPTPAPAPGTFGATCAGSNECTSGLCANDTYTNSHYCTQMCNQATPCPTGADCVATGDTHVCALAEQPGGNNAAGEGAALLGSCSVGRGPGGAAALWPCLLALALLIGASMRRRRA